MKYIAQRKERMFTQICNYYFIIIISPPERNVNVWNPRGERVSGERADVTRASVLIARGHKHPKKEPTHMGFARL